MNNLLPIAVLGAAGAVLVGVGAWLWVRLMGYRRVPRWGGISNGEIATDRYAPMARLLSEDDLEFLRQFPGCRSKLAARWERERRQIFRMYLREAAWDFQRLHQEARLLVANAPEEHADLVGKLMRQQAVFWFIMARTELRLALDALTVGRLGISKTDTARIIGLVEAMRSEAGLALSLAPL